VPLQVIERNDTHLRGGDRGKRGEETECGEEQALHRIDDTGKKRRAER
jgi:hypothetical protein